MAFRPPHQADPVDRCRLEPACTPLALPKD